MSKKPVNVETIPSLLSAKMVAELCGWYKKNGRLNIDRAVKYILRLEARQPGVVIRNPATNRRMVHWHELALRNPDFAAVLIRDRERRDGFNENAR